jgi:hypothetical protein
MALRWCAAGMIESGKQFRRSTDIYTCEPYATHWNTPPELSVPPTILTPSAQPDDHRTPPKFHGTRDILRV